MNQELADHLTQNDQKIRELEAKITYLEWLLNLALGNNINKRSDIFQTENPALSNE
jgi:hypothetical protein